MAVDGFASIRNDPRQSKRERRVNPHTFLYGRVEIFERSGRGGIDVDVFGEPATNLVAETFPRVGRVAEMVDDA